MTELALADRMRVSHSHLRGGPALWTPEDLEKALAYRSYESDRCGGCGAHREDWAGGQHPYEAYAYRCPGCEDIGTLQATMRDAPPDATHGIRFGLRRSEDDPA